MPINLSCYRCKLTPGANGGCGYEGAYLNDLCIDEDLQCVGFEPVTCSAPLSPDEFRYRAPVIKLRVFTEETWLKKK